MDANLKDVIVMRVANGWIVRSGPRMDRFDTPNNETMVARSPGELAQILTDWATAQQSQGVK